MWLKCTVNLNHEWFAADSLMSKQLVFAPDDHNLTWNVTKSFQLKMFFLYRVTHTYKAWLKSSGTGPIKMRSHIWFQFVSISGPSSQVCPCEFRLLLHFLKTSILAACSACSAVLWFRSESKHLPREQPNQKHALLVSFWNLTLLYCKFIPQGEPVIVEFNLSRGVWGRILEKMCELWRMPACHCGALWKRGRFVATQTHFSLTTRTTSRPCLTATLFSWLEKK